jgi:hypothetical protein
MSVFSRFSSSTIHLAQLGGIEQTLSEALQPPEISAVRKSVAVSHSLVLLPILSYDTAQSTIFIRYVTRQVLKDFKALDAQTEELTPLGYHLAQLPVSIHIGKLLLFGAILRYRCALWTCAVSSAPLPDAAIRCIDPVLTIAAVLSSKSPFVFPLEKRKEARAAQMTFAQYRSDHMTFVAAFNQYRTHKKRGAERQFCSEVRIFLFVTAESRTATKKEIIKT